MTEATATTIRCHYEILGVEQDADAATIKKSHRKMALKYHPDKNLGNDESAAEQFRLVQQAYECLSDPQERKWYDDHRDAILAGWSSGGGGDMDKEGMDMIFDVVHYMHPGCYNGYDDLDKQGYYQVFKGVFEEIVLYERKGQSSQSIELPTDFGSSKTEWKSVQQFYQIWESFVSALNFAWEDKYNSREDAPDRRIRRLMDDENKKARRAAKKTYNQDILALVAFIKRRDPRVKAKQAELVQQKLEKEKVAKEQALKKKEEKQKRQEEWRTQSQQHKSDMEEQDRMAGRVRLADLQDSDEDSYDYGGKRKGKKKKGKRGKGKKNNKNTNEYGDDKIQEERHEVRIVVGEEEREGKGGTGNDGSNDEIPAEATEEAVDDDADDGNTVEVDPVVEALQAAMDDGYYSNDDEESEGSEQDEEPDVWRCECCRKDFKSEGQMENHMKSKKHKQQFQKYQAKMKKQAQDQQERAILADMMDDMEME